MASLIKTIQALYGSEINCGVQTFFDRGFDVWIGDSLNGERAMESFAIEQEWAAAEWLDAAARRLCPNSAYAIQAARRCAHRFGVVHDEGSKFFVCELCGAETVRTD